MKGLKKFGASMSNLRGSEAVEKLERKQAMLRERLQQELEDEQDFSIHEKGGGKSIA